jgi:hypothetical protein
VYEDWWFHKKTSTNAITLFPFIFIQDKSYKDSPYATYSRYLEMKEKDMEHEKQHWKQQRFITLPIFLVIYVLNYVVNLIYYLDHRKAYTNIWFERDAVKASLK